MSKQDVPTKQNIKFFTMAYKYRFSKFSAVAFYYVYRKGDDGVCNVKLSPISLWE
jgi:hypothetical protein